MRIPVYILKGLYAFRLRRSVFDIFYELQHRTGKNPIRNLENELKPFFKILDDRLYGIPVSMNKTIDINRIKWANFNHIKEVINKHNENSEFIADPIRRMHVSWNARSSRRTKVPPAKAIRQGL